MRKYDILWEVWDGTTLVIMVLEKWEQKQMVPADNAHELHLIICHLKQVRWLVAVLCGWAWGSLFTVQMALYGNYWTLAFDTF